jgi:nicotinate-nucleotide adenylyltransferase
MGRFEIKKEDLLKRIGLFGGTFNPIHLGHLWAAETVRKNFGLGSIIFIPSAVPPHKEPDGVAPARDRFDMLCLALAKTSFTASDVELKRKGPSYTIDTVRHFQSTGSKETIFFLIVGLDAFVEMDTWKLFQDLFSSIPMLVLPRPFASTDVNNKMHSLVVDFLKTNVSTDYRFSESEGVFSHPNKQPIHLFRQKMLDISATAIRATVAQGKAVDALVPEPVKDYILQKGLYR